MSQASRFAESCFTFHPDSRALKSAVFFWMLVGALLTTSLRAQETTPTQTPTLTPTQTPTPMQTPTPTPSIETTSPDQGATQIVAAQQIVDRIETTPHTQWFDQLDEAKRLVDKARVLSPDDQRAKALQQTIRDLLKSKQTAYKQLIEQASWSAHAESFKGKGNADELAAAALDWLKNDATWSERSPFAARLDGSWKETGLISDAFNLQWGLPIQVACRLDGSKDDDAVARVYSLLILTESRRNVPQAPPFTAVQNNGEAFDILQSRVAIVSKPPQGRMWWTLLWIANVVAGLLLLEPAIKRSSPGGEAVYRALAPMSAGLGVLIMLVGALRLVGAILTWSLMMNLLPTVSAVLGGAVLCRALLPKPLLFASLKPFRVGDKDQHMRGAMTTAQKTTHDLPDAEQLASEMADQTVADSSAPIEIVKNAGSGRTVSDYLETVARYQPRLGLVCLFLGAVHLVAAHLWLF